MKIFIKKFKKSFKYSYERICKMTTDGRMSGHFNCFCEITLDYYENKKFKHPVINFLLSKQKLIIPKTIKKYKTFYYKYDLLE